MKLIETLLAMSQHGSVESAIETVCEKHGFARTQNSSEWKYLFPVAPESRVLELGAGVGDDTIALSSEASEVVAAVPSQPNADLLQRRLREHEITNAQVAVLDTAANLPWSDASFGGIAMEDAAAGGFNLCGQTLPKLARECYRLLQPGGCVCLGLSNPLHTSGPLQILKAKQQAAHHPESLNRMIKCEDRTRAETLRLGSVTRAMQAAGFSAPQLFAPMPDEKQTKAVLPLDSSEALHYYFDHLMRSDTVLIRSATQIMKALVRLGMIQLVVPYYFALFRRQDEPVRHQSPTEN